MNYSDVQDQLFQKAIKQLRNPMSGKFHVRRSQWAGISSLYWLSRDTNENISRFMFHPFQGN